MSSKKEDKKPTGKRPLVPKLRFPEFRDAGEWEEKPIGKELDLLSGFPFDGADIGEDASGIPLMRGINITEGYIRHTKEIDRFFCGSIAGIEKYRLSANDLVIGMDGSKVGKNSALLTGADAGALLVQRVARLRASAEPTIRFVFHHINSNIFHDYVNRINTSGGIPHISLKQISDFHIGFPDIFEQQKIADCLSSLDELISLEAQRLDALKAHKKGMMQQLFPGEGETVPRLRFPEFRDAGEWEEKSLEKVSISISSGNDKSDPAGLYNLYGSTGVIGKTSTASYKGEFILAARVGVNAGLLTKAVGEFGVTDNTLTITLKNTIHLDFVFHYLDNWSLNKLIFGSGQPLITGNQLKALSIFVPSPSEQQRIADCLSSLDELINAQSARVADLKIFKKGLMQRLFPAMKDAHQ